MTHRIPLNPCDYLYYVHQRHIHQAGTGGGVGFLVAQAAGVAEPAAVQAAFTAALRAHPILLAQLHVDPIWSRPYWRVPGDTNHAACQAAQNAYQYDDLRSSPDWQGRLDALLIERFRPRWELSPAPQILLEHYCLPDNNTWLCIRWPHMLMDAGGGQWFLSELGRFSAGDPGPKPPELADDHLHLDPLQGLGLRQRFRLCRRGLSSKHDASLKISPLNRRTDARPESLGLLRRTWLAEQVRQMRSNAERFAPAGPARHARFLGACVLRAVHQIHVEHSHPAGACAISLPLSMTEPDESDEAAESANSSRRRPLPGNYLVAPTLYGRPELMHDRAALGSDLLMQLQRYYSAEGPQAQWALMWLASKMRLRMYDSVYRRRIGVDPLSSGFSYYGQIQRPLRRFCGMKITNIWGTAPLATPPGWNPIFNKHQGKLNLGLAYNKPAVADQLAERFVTLIEREIFAD